MQMLIEAVRSIWATCLTANGCSLNPSSLCKWPTSAGCCSLYDRPLPSYARIFGTATRPPRLRRCPALRTLRARGCTQHTAHARAGKGRRVRGAAASTSNRAVDMARLGHSRKSCACEFMLELDIHVRTIMMTTNSVLSAIYGRLYIAVLHERAPEPGVGPHKHVFPRPCLCMPALAPGAPDGENACGCAPDIQAHAPAAVRARTQGVKFTAVAAALDLAI